MSSEIEIQREAYLAKLRSRRRPEFMGIPLYGQSHLKADDVLEGITLTGLGLHRKQEELLFKANLQGFMLIPKPFRDSLN